MSTENPKEPPLLTTIWSFFLAVATALSKGLEDFRSLQGREKYVREENRRLKSALVEAQDRLADRADRVKVEVQNPDQATAYKKLQGELKAVQAELVEVKKTNTTLAAKNEQLSIKSLSLVESIKGLKKQLAALPAPIGAVGTEGN